MAPAALRTVAEELYGVVLEEFTAARTRAERDARAAGDRQLAAAVKALRKPVVAAWAVNQLVRRRRDLVEEVVALGDLLREAQSGLDGEQLRELTRQRRRLVAAVTAEARQVAAGLGQRLTDTAHREVEETLSAAMADPAAAAAVLSGTLTQPLSSTGLESLGVTPADVVAVPAAPQLRVVTDDGRARREAEERLEAAQAGVDAATKAVGSLERKRAKAEARLLRLEAEQEELRRRLADLETAAEAAAERVEGLDARLAQARSECERAQADAAAAAAALEGA